MQNAYKKSGPCGDCYLCENRVPYAFEGKKPKPQTPILRAVQETQSSCQETLGKSFLKEML